MEPAYNFQEFRPERPRFLTIICILTFIGSSYGIINSAITFFNAESIHKLLAEENPRIMDDISKKNGGKKEDMNFAKKIMADVSEITTPDNIRRSSIANAVGALLCLLGALLMWRLKKAGFYIYIIGTITGILLPYYLLGGNIVTNLQAAFLAFIGILFVIFYAMNLKSMK